MTPWFWINTPAQLLPWLQRDVASICIDTEFIRENTYWPDLALVQIAIDTDILLIDVQSDGMKEALCPWLLAPHITKIMHSAREDIIALQHACDATPFPLFDTQIAAAFLGLGVGLSYQKLVTQITGVVLDKQHTRSAWQQRPLTRAQMQYAADDVRYLGEIYQNLHERLIASQRIDWFYEDCAQLAASENNDGELKPRDLAQALRFLDSNAQQRFFRLMRWRQTYALESNMPRNWVLDVGLATLLARTPPENSEALHQHLASFPRTPGYLAHQIWEILNTPLSKEAHTMMTFVDLHTPCYQRALKQMQTIVSTTSKTVGLPESLLASRRHLEAFIQQRRWPKALGTWRQQLLESQLSACLPAET